MALQKPANVPDTSERLRLYVALQSIGILEISFDPSQAADQSLKIEGVNTNAGFMPGWLSVYGNRLYSISRMGYPDSKSDSGGVFGFRAKSTASNGPGALTSGLTALNNSSSNGKGGVHCEVSPDGKLLAAANITASTVSIYPLSETGLIGKAIHILDYSKTSPGTKDDHPHQASFDPSGRFIMVPLRTGDRIDVFSVESLPELPLVESIQVPGPAGPRHLAFNKNQADNVYMYLASEKDNTIRVYQVDYEQKRPALTLVQTTSTIAGGVAPTPAEHKSLAAEIAVSNDGRHVYVSNRNVSLTEPDTITIYSVSQSSSGGPHLKFIATQSIPGKHPRMFALSNDKENKWLAVANQWTQDVVIFERDAGSGLLKDIMARISVKVDADLRQQSGEVRFAEDKGTESELSPDERQKATTEGPMCIAWKPQGTSMAVKSVL